MGRRLFAGVLFGVLVYAGMALWVNDNGNGPGHSSRNTPVVIAGSAGGFLKQGEYLVMPDSDGWGEESINHARLLNTIGSAAGLRDSGGDYISDFGDPLNNRAPLPELMA